MTVTFQFTSLVVNGEAALAPTSNPLVEMLSTPVCPTGSSISAFFYEVPGGPFIRTNWKPCQSTASNNFYLAGLHASSYYVANYQIAKGSTVTTGPKTLVFRTGTPLVTFPTITDLIPPTIQADPSIQVVLHDFLPTGFPLATDRAGNVIWYYPEAAANVGEGVLITRPLNQGTMLMYLNGVGENPSVTGQQILREIDLAGNTIRETNASRLAEQTVAMGTDPVTSVHHDAIRLANGNTIILTSAERIFPAGTQGSPTPVDIIGDLILVLDTNFQVIWYWNAFDHLDISRAAILGETCTNGEPGCPPVTLASIANDWLHSNSLYYSTADGNIMMSIRHQDWVIKIDYANGAGTGHILWRLGLDGDFTMNSGLSYPWFSHQHDAGFESNGLLTLFDNGDTRRMVQGGGNSRGQVLSVDQVNKVVNLVVNTDLGLYAYALGSAQLLPNGNYMFQAGIFPFGGTPTFSQTIEVLTDGTHVFDTQGPASYRSWLMPSFYTPPNT